MLAWGANYGAWRRTAAVVVAAACCLTLLAVVYQRQREPQRDESLIAALVTAAGKDVRPLEPRLSSAVAWAPFHGGREPSLMMAATIQTTLAKVRGTASPVASHTTGVAQLLKGETRDATATLLAAAEASNQPALWSDLAVAYYETSLRHDAPQLLADALMAADRALALDPRLHAALFNRALILERLGLRDLAREAWERYAAADPASDWAAEARTHRDALAPEKPFLEVLDREYERVANDPATAAEMVRRDPHGARARGVQEILGRWGRAVLNGRAGESARHLNVARRLGSAVTAHGGDRMLERSVAAIDAADDAKRMLLAQGHADYDAGLSALQKGEPTEGAAGLRRAAARFEQGGSPMALAARYFTANAVYEQGRRAESEREMERLLASVGPEFPAYRAFIEWQLGICHASRADYGAAIELLEASAASLDRLGESDNAAGVRRILAVIHDRIGDHTTAWTYHMAALRGLGRRPGIPLEKAVTSVADSAIVRRDWAVAASFLTLHIETARRLGHDLQEANTLLIRAVVLDRLQQGNGARADIADAALAAARVKDPAYVAFLRMASLRARAMLADTPPVEADALLTEAIEFQAARSDPFNVPGLLLQRARARRSAGNREGAMADVESGIATLERHRQSLPPGEARWGAFHAAEELFDEGIELALSEKDAVAAFVFAEKARGRALLEAYRQPAAIDFRKLPPGTTIIEFAALPSQLVVFTVDAGGVRASTVACSRETLQREIEALVRAVRADDQSALASAARAVYERLLAPAAAQVAGGGTLVFVPDAATTAVPFAVLRDPQGRHLVETHTIAVAPSAAVYAAAAARRRPVQAPRGALVVAAPDAAGGGGALAFADAEANRIAALYPAATRIARSGAQLEELSALAPEADVIHFAGHAVGDERGYAPASIFLRHNGRERRVRVAELAKLQLRAGSIVVLAGCSTARGERKASEGVVSVAHGFLSAGASSVIATLWPIDDSAASAFFPRLHAQLAAGVSPAEAVRAMQLDALRNRDVPVSFWAALQTIGY
ncbi:MAG TPA: CHAT domain-containing protein [Thermoanaerobaculia bacterium]